MRSKSFEVGPRAMARPDPACGPDPRRHRRPWLPALEVGFAWQRSGRCDRGRQAAHRSFQASLDRHGDGGQRGVIAKDKGGAPAMSYLETGSPVHVSPRRSNCPDCSGSLTVLQRDAAAGRLRILGHALRPLRRHSSRHRQPRSCTPEHDGAPSGEVSTRPSWWEPRLRFLRVTWMAVRMRGNSRLADTC